MDVIEAVGMWTLFVVASLVLFAATLAAPLAPALTMLTMRASTSAEIALRVMLVGHLIALVRTAGLAVMIAGVVRLASSARGEPREHSAAA